MQLDGFTVVAEYGSRFEADLAAHRLTGDGIQATVLSDPAHQIAAHIVTQRGHQVLVTDARTQAASMLLAETNDDHGEAAPAASAYAADLDGSGGLPIRSSPRSSFPQLVRRCACWWKS